MPSIHAASIAHRIGYTDIKVFPGGYPEWVGKGYEIER
jgi:rhodanese-related sulfurtransferase